MIKGATHFVAKLITFAQGQRASELLRADLTCDACHCARPVRVQYLATGQELIRERAAQMLIANCLRCRAFGVCPAQGWRIQ